MSDFSENAVNAMIHEMSTKEEIVSLSYALQRQWRFAKEKVLMEKAASLFSEWGYAQKRLEWHTRPVFHKDPSKSKTQPRKPLNLPRDPNFTPKQETIDSLCFVTASGSDQPYFDLSIQLLESIKASRWYNHVPIKILDCGLSPEDADYLRQRFEADVKDPGWDVNTSYINNRKGAGHNGFKGLTARPYIHKHFPGYTYYFWMDTDCWVQDDRALDQFVHLCETQKMGVAREFFGHQYWKPNAAQSERGMYATIPSHDLAFLSEKRCLINNVYCIHTDLNELYAKECDRAIEQIKNYAFGFDLVMLNVAFHKYVQNGRTLDDRIWNDIDKWYFGPHIDDQKYLKLNTDHSVYLGIVNLESNIKGLPHRLLFAHGAPHEYKMVLRQCMSMAHMPEMQAQEEEYRLVQTRGWKQGSYFYRIYPDPADLYGLSGIGDHQNNGQNIVLTGVSEVLP